jgi:hypothetical protein
MIRDGKEIFISGVNKFAFDFMRPIYVSPDYPTYPENIKIPDKFSEGYWYGYSDHTHGIAAPLLAIARGAKFVEVHCTLDKTEESIRDNHFACTRYACSAWKTDCEAGMSDIWNYIKYYGNNIKCAKCPDIITDGKIVAVVGNSSDGPMDYICQNCVDKYYDRDTAREK